MNSLVDQAEAAMRQGRFAEAKSALQEALNGALDAGLKVEARSMLGLAMTALGEVTPALAHLRAAAAAEPGEAMFRYNLGRGLEAAQDFPAAIAEHREAVRLAPGMAPLEIALAQALLGAGDFAAARPLLEKYANNTQAPPVVTRLLVQALAGAGDTHAALDAAKRLVPADISRADAQGRADALMAANLAHAGMYYPEAARIAQALVQRDQTDAEATALLGQLLLWMNGPAAASELLQDASVAGASSPRLLVDRLALAATTDDTLQDKAVAMATDETLGRHVQSDILLALAQYYDRMGDAAKAWSYAARGKAVTPSNAAPGIARDWRATLATQLDVFDSVDPVENSANGPHHLYLLGLPRSGQSLIQSVLAAAPETASIGERGALLQHLLYRQDEIAGMGAGPRQALFGDLARSDLNGIERLTGSPKWVVDKSPLHIAIVGNIARVHPAARFAAVLRDPADVAVSIWLRRFPPAYDYANDFESILDHIEFALDALEAWKQAGISIRLLDFQRFLRDPAGEAEKVFAWLDISWQATFLDPAQRTEPVPTYSAAQVRLPVGQGGSRGAGPYSDHLEPFAAKLAHLRAKQSALLAGAE